MKPSDRARNAASPLSDRLSTRLPSNTIWPLVGRSTPPKRFSSVVLPEPDGPMMARNAPRSIVMSSRSKIGTAALPRLYDLPTPCSSTSALIRPTPQFVSPSRNRVFAAMSGSTRGSRASIATRTFTVALPRSAVGMIAATDAGMRQSG